jgi:hypothetical protein
MESTAPWAETLTRPSRPTPFSTAPAQIAPLLALYDGPRYPGPFTSAGSVSLAHWPDLSVVVRTPHERLCVVGPPRQRVFLPIVSLRSASCARHGRSSVHLSASFAWSRDLKPSRVFPLGAIQRVIASCRHWRRQKGILPATIFEVRAERENGDWAAAAYFCARRRSGAREWS